MRPVFLLLTLALVVAGCSSGDEPSSTLETSTSQQPTESPTPADPAPTSTVPDVTVPSGIPSTTSGPQSGNRVASGSADLRTAAPIDVDLSGVPAWVVGAAVADGVVWVVVLEDGSLQAWTTTDSGAEPHELDISHLPPGTPPLVVASGDTVSVVAPPADASPLTHPVVVDGGIAYVTIDGDLRIMGETSPSTLAIDALRDTRLTVGADGLIALLAGPTDRYAHGVLGDAIEASRLVVVDPVAAEIVTNIVIPEPAVIEGIAAAWVDVDGDGSEELLVTVSDASRGAWLMVYDVSGEIVAQGPPIGQGNRWRNQLGAAPIGPNGAIEVVDVRVPHIGGVVEFFRLDGQALSLEVAQPGLTSHVIGSRNLDLALIADTTGDGSLNVVLPTQDRSELVLLARVDDGVAVAGLLELPDRLASNLSAVSHAGSLSMAAGTSDGTLRIWPGG